MKVIEARDMVGKGCNIIFTRHMKSLYEETESIQSTAVAFYSKASHLPTRSEAIQHEREAANMDDGFMAE